MESKKKKNFIVYFHCLNLLLSACSQEKKYPLHESSNDKKLRLEDVGQKDIVDYHSFGDFINLGTPKYHYIIRDKEGLAKAVGEGIYPNISIPSKKIGVFYGQKNSQTFELTSHYPATQENLDYLLSLDLSQISSSITNRPEGLRLFLLGKIFEDAGMWLQALKAYYALLVHFPDTVAKEKNGTGISLGNRAIYAIKKICREHPELGFELIGSEIYIENLDEGPLKIFALNPGYFVKKPQNQSSTHSTSSSILYKSGSGKVYVEQSKNGDWQLMVGKEPFFIKGVVANINKIGTTPDFRRNNQWERNDSQWYKESWTDLNYNHKKDPGEECWNDINLFKYLGVNTIRLYFGATNKKALRELNEQAGIRFIMGMPMGSWSFDSGVEYPDKTDYSDLKQQNAMLENFKSMVMRHKDEPYVLLWMLGNENNLGFGSNAKTNPQAFALFLEKAAKLIHEWDPDHPVAYSNGDIKLLDYFAKYTPSLDIFATNMYRRELGFEELFDRVKKIYNKPVFVSEFGYSAFTEETDEDEMTQAAYLEECWKDIEFNKAGGSGAGNSLGGVVFEWLDEWAKEGSPYRHDKYPNAPGSWIYEEWLGIISQEESNDSPHMRKLRRSFFELQKLWKPESSAHPMIPCQNNHHGDLRHE